MYSSVFSQWTCPRSLKKYPTYQIILCHFIKKNWTKYLINFCVLFESLKYIRDISVLFIRFRWVFFVWLVGWLVDKVDKVDVTNAGTDDWNIERKAKKEKEEKRSRLEKTEMKSDTNSGSLFVCDTDGAIARWCTTDADRIVDLVSCFSCLLVCLFVVFLVFRQNGRPNFSKERRRK